MATISEALAIAIQHHQMGRLEAAEQIYRQVLAVEPNQADANHLLGALAFQVGKPEIAVEFIQRAIKVNGADTVFHYNLGVVFLALGKLEAAISCFRRSLELKPDYVEAHYNLGNAYQTQGMLDEAISCFRQAVELNADYFEAHNNLGSVFHAMGKMEEAVTCYRRALELNPNYAEAHNNLSVAFHDEGKLDDALACNKRALELNADYADAHNNRGNAFKDQGRLDDAVACYRRAVACSPNRVGLHSNLLYALHFHPSATAKMLAEECRQWNERHAAPLAKFIQFHANERSPERRLRIGYVFSPDFCSHCQALFTVPLFSAHDHRNFEIFCYADVACPDETTARLRSLADAWRNIVGRRDEEIAQMIRHDQIDILVDLTMHMSHNRALVLRRKPAPVQVCWLAYPGTTGQSAIDYRLTDVYLDPPGLHDDYYAEESIRLPNTFWCYDPQSHEPAVNPLPAIERGYVTFGCLNNFCKVNPAVLKLWAQVMKAVERSRLLILAAEGGHRQETLTLLAKEGIASGRVLFVGEQPRAEYLKLYNGIDVGLDTFPYNGHTTSLDSYWMGVPVVTLVGQTVVGRAGLSQLTNLKLAELIAETPEQFVSIALGLVGDLQRLSQLRATLPERMQGSPLMDARRFARNIEVAYRGMWQRWCAK